MAKMKVQQNRASCRLSCTQRLTFRSELGDQLVLYRVQRKIRTGASRLRTRRREGTTSSRLTLRQQLCRGEDCSVSLVGGSCYWCGGCSSHEQSSQRLRGQSDGGFRCQLFHKHSGTIPKRPVSGSDFAEQSGYQPRQHWSGGAHGAGGDRLRPLSGNHDQGSDGRPAWSESSDFWLWVRHAARSLTPVHVKSCAEGRTTRCTDVITQAKSDFSVQPRLTKSSGAQGKPFPRLEDKSLRERQRGHRRNTYFVCNGELMRISLFADGGVVTCVGRVRTLENRNQVVVGLDFVLFGVSTKPEA